LCFYFEERDSESLQEGGKKEVGNTQQFALPGSGIKLRLSQEY